MTTERYPNSQAIALYSSKNWNEFEDIIISFAGKIAMTGCSSARLHIIEALYSVIESRSGATNTDHDTERYYRRNLLPMASKLLAQADEAAA